MKGVSTVMLALTAVLCGATLVRAGELALGNAQGQPGHTVTVPLVYMAGPRAAAAVASDIRFDARALRNPRCAAGGALNGTGKQVRCAEPKRGLLRIAIFGLNLSAVPNGEVAQVTFDVSPNAPFRRYALRQRASAADAEGKDFLLKHRNAKLSVGG